MTEESTPNASPAYPEPQQVCTCCGVACGACYARQFEAANATPRPSKTCPCDHKHSSHETCDCKFCDLGRRPATDSSGPATPAEDLRDADLDRLTARECFEYLSRGLEGGEAAILKAVAMTRAHERRKRRP